MKPEAAGAEAGAGAASAGAVVVRVDFTRRCDDPSKEGAGTETLVLDPSGQRIQRIDVVLR